ncbi:MAG: RidA family protein [Actinomycetota bacterium]
MEQRAINPTAWLNAFNIHNGIEVTGAERMLLLSGQTATAADGSPQHPGDIVAQFGLAWSNLKDVLTDAGMTPANVVRLNMYVTDVPTFMANAEAMISVIAADGCTPTSTLLGVSALFDPSIMVELEATAAA